MEMNKRYGWSKFIIVVPSVAIREGVKKWFDITADHFQQHFGTKPRSFIYNSAQLHELERFSSDAGVQVMIINIQAFNSKSKDNRRIYEELDDFQSRRPIDVISANRPIVIIDEPQKIQAKTSLESLANFDALMILRYSATHRVEHNKVHRLDAVDAYNQKLVKRIGVRGITVKGLAGSSAYLYLDSIEVKKGAPPSARLELEVQTANGGIKRRLVRVTKGSRLHDLANGVEAYRNLVVNDVDAIRDVIELSSGDVVVAGQLADNDVTEETKRRIQIREVVRAHLDRERSLFGHGIKVLSLFFIDEVVKYRDYGREDEQGDYARVFEEEYEAAVQDLLGQLPLEPGAAEYREHLERHPVRSIHEGYFSIDKKSKQLIDPKVSGRGDDKGLASDVSAYDLILKDKERLLSFDEPVRFIFSHSALREGWDNPNVFVMGMLKKSDNTISRRQEIGRGLRICVNQQGERMDDPATVHDINVLTVVTDESYTDFVGGLQKEIAESLASRPRKATKEFFAGKLLEDPNAPGETVEITNDMAVAIEFYLIKNDYVDKDRTLSAKWDAASAAGELEDFPEEVDGEKFHYQLVKLIESLNWDAPAASNDRGQKSVPLNEENFAKKEFQELWGRISRKAVYQVEFDSDELIRKCISALDHELTVDQLQYVVEEGSQHAALAVDDVKSGDSFSKTKSRTETETRAVISQVKYDLLGEITEKTQLIRKTAAAILQGVTPSTFEKYRSNPEQFITRTAKIINEQKASVIVEHLTYDTLEDRHDSSIFTDNQSKQDFTKAGSKLKKHIYDYVVTDSSVERSFVDGLDISDEVVVYAKLPNGFKIPTPVGDYNPDWAIAFKEGSVKHVYFVAETKGSDSSLELRGTENAKIASARKFFDTLNESASGGEVKYDVVTDYSGLMSLVGAP